MDLAANYVPYSHEIEIYAANLMEQNGVDAKDALHVACAVQAECNFMITTDKKLIRRTGLIGEMRVINPVHFVTDYIGYVEYEK